MIVEVSYLLPEDKVNLFLQEVSQKISPAVCDVSMPPGSVGEHSQKQITLIARDSSANVLKRAIGPGGVLITWAPWKRTEIIKNHQGMQVS